MSSFRVISWIDFFYAAEDDPRSCTKVKAGPACPIICGAFPRAGGLMLPDNKSQVAYRSRELAIGDKPLDSTSWSGLACAHPSNVSQQLAPEQQSERKGLDHLQLY